MSRKNINQRIQKSYICEECGNTFKDRRNFKRHQRIHNPEEWFTCEYCNKRFADKRNLNRHRKIHTLAGWYTCNICDKSFSQSGHLKTHISNVHDKKTAKPLKNKIYQCGECSKSYDAKDHLQNHYASFHQKIPSPVCTLCGSSFATKYALNYHCKKIHNSSINLKDFPSCYNLEVPKPKSRIVCKKCNRTYVDKYKVKTHIPTCKSRMNYKCPTEECKSIFTSKVILNKHKHRCSKYKSEYIWKCTAKTCTKAFTTFLQCAEHIKKSH